MPPQALKDVKLSLQVTRVNVKRMSHEETQKHLTTKRKVDKSKPIIVTTAMASVLGSSLGKANGELRKMNVMTINELRQKMKEGQPTLIPAQLRSPSSSSSTTSLLADFSDEADSPKKKIKTTSTVEKKDSNNGKAKKSETKKIESKSSETKKPVKQGKTIPSSVKSLPPSKNVETITIVSSNSNSPIILDSGESNDAFYEQTEASKKRTNVDSGSLIKKAIELSQKACKYPVL